jgi:hypothetical protein
LTDYRYWFGAGRSTIKPDQFTPKMVDAIEKMLKDPKESWWVVDGALMAIRFAKPQDIERCLPHILRWAEHDDWWLRESAFMAMSGVQSDDNLLEKVLPTMNKMMVHEYHTQPRQRMLGALQRIMRQKKRDSAAGKSVMDAFMQAVTEGKILPNEGNKRRATEGAFNVVGAAAMSIREAPETAVAVATSLEKRFDVLETKQLISLVGAPNSSPDGKAFGFYTVLAKQKSPEQKAELQKVLNGVYLPELKKRLKEGNSRDMELINSIIDLAKLDNPNAGWNAVGTPAPAERVWRFMTFDPVQEKDEKHPREKRRFRKVQLPEGLDKWYMPEFDDSKWLQGGAPIGVGTWRRGKNDFKNASEWGDGEFLLARTTFEADTSVEYDSYRLSILAKNGFNVYLNGRGINSYGWWKDSPQYRPIMLNEKSIKKLLKPGKNVLAVYANIEYQKSSAENRIGKVDLMIEGLRRSDLE